VREPAAWRADPGPRLDAARVAAAIRGAMRGPADDAWEPPGWLLEHQRDATRRIAGALTVFGGALLADAVGLGKTYVALAVATRYRRVTLVVPATLRGQWRDAAGQSGLRPGLMSHEALSRGARPPPCDLIVVDEAHRFRNATTYRYDALARGVRGAHVLMVTATPVVNGVRDLSELLRLFLPDGALAGLGVPSLAAAGAQSPAALMHAVLPLVVARTPSVVRLRDHLPVARDGEVRELATLEPRPLRAVLRALGGLRFPPLRPEGGALLRHHLLLRLASSAQALGSSLRRHRRYVERAMDAAARGERLGRGAACALLREADAEQLELLLAVEGTAPVSARALRAEHRRLDALLAILARAARDPKRESFVAALAANGARRVLVFTVARATALALAAALGWRRVAVATGAGARIASGPVSLEEALRRFAPHARGGSVVPPALAVDVLVATDLASEGLNLQDADVVAHYDLPWNPLRLAQRVGRTVRLGGMHDQVDVWWFAPPESIERTLGSLERIVRKAAVQLTLPVPATSLVGRARVVSDVLERRERAIRDIACPVRGHAVVSGPVGAKAVIRWDASRGPLREAVDLAGGEVFDVSHRGPSDGPIPPGTLAALRHAVLVRARSSSRVTLSPTSRLLARRVLAAARVAGARRDRRLLSCLDGVLARLRDGVAVGAERELADQLCAPAAEALEVWLGRHPARDPGLRAPTLETALVGADPDR
jgi:superfamily II DNA or RNA helicase